MDATPGVLFEVDGTLVDVELPSHPRLVEGVAGAGEEVATTRTGTDERAGVPGSADRRGGA